MEKQIDAEAVELAEGAEASAPREASLQTPIELVGVVAGEEQRAGARSPPREQFSAPSPRHLRELRVDQFCSAGERARRALRFPRHTSPSRVEPGRYP